MGKVRETLMGLGPKHCESYIIFKQPLEFSSLGRMSLMWAEFNEPDSAVNQLQAAPRALRW